ncbi:uncharacterized protein LOC134659752 [Cydia amplana]|uniref:uncharacterized protein LOC134659752 n=1 Tax=Cydia amplana TaxID=1869771 RepID=UPI002FE5CB3E
MTNIPFMDKLRSFLGIGQEPPRNDFRNPIWGDDDDDDGDELYSRTYLDEHREDFNVFSDPRDIHSDIARQMHDMFQAFGSIFGDMKTFIQDFENGHTESSTNTPAILLPAEPDQFDSKNIRDYYLKPGYHNNRNQHDKEDIDLDGKISSQDIAGLLKQKDDENKSPTTHFNSDLVQGRSFCRTIITTSITKPDGSKETKRIVKDGNGVVEETITTTEPDPRGLTTAMDSFSPANYGNVFSEFSSIFRNFY